MPEALKCPECSAALEQPTDGSQTLRCPYCRSSVLLDRAVVTQRHDIPPAHNGPADDRSIVRTSAPGNRTSIALWIVAGLGLFVLLFPMVMGLVMFGVRRSNQISPPMQISAVPQLELPAALLPQTRPATPGFATQVMKFGSKGIGAGQFKDARSIAVDGAGHIYVGEYTGGRVQVFDSAGKFLKAWSANPKEALINLAASREGVLLVIGVGKISIFDGVSGRASGEAQAHLDDRSVYYNDACFNLAGEIVALDMESNIRLLDSAGQIKRTIPAKQNSGDDDAAFDKIAVSGDGKMYVVDRHKGIFQFAPDGRYINRFGAADESDPLDRRPDTLHSAMNLTIDGQGRIIVGDLNPAVKVFDSSGRFLGSFGAYDVCFGIAVDDANRILCCFRNDNEIRGYEFTK